MKSLEFKGFTSPTTKVLAALFFPFFSFHHSRLKWWIGVQFLLLSLPQVQPPKLLQISHQNCCKSATKTAWFLLGYSPSQPAFLANFEHQNFCAQGWCSNPKFSTQNPNSPLGFEFFPAFFLAAHSRPSWLGWVSKNSSNFSCLLSSQNRTP